MGSRSRTIIAVIAVIAALTAAAPAAASQRAARVAPPAFLQIQQGPNGGSIWQGVIPNRIVPQAARASLLYLPPNPAPSARYPVVYLLHGLPGSPNSFADGLQLAQTADQLIASGAVPPFVAVMPPAGVAVRYRGEWTGPWEQYLVQNVVPWVDTHLPVLRSAGGRTVAGLSAGGYGAIDIGLRHPGIFGTLESWSGMYRAPHDGTLAGASTATLAAHDPMSLLRQQATSLRRQGVRVFLSVASSHDRVTQAQTEAFAAMLKTRRVPYRLFEAGGGHHRAFWRQQLAPALRYALHG